MNTRSQARAFSLVELVIVVVIIGVIAAIAVPRISRGARGAGEAALRGDLASLRNSIDMYAAEHGGTWPGADGSDVTLTEQLTKKTNASGATTGSNLIYGPYLRGGFPPIPVGPNVGESGVILTTAADITTAVDQVLAPTKGWVYNYETGDIIANTNDPDEKGDGFETY